ncbi:hypothetical protein BG004_002943 [Podila humilis]|nr:hypothetical protein BG004_002943 [Podila humilis]
MAVKKQKKTPAKRRRAPVTAGTGIIAAGSDSFKNITSTHTAATAAAAAAAATDTDSLSVLMAMTPSGAETTSSTSSLLTVKSTKAVAHKKSSLATAQLIRTYHTLNKQLSKCLARIEASKNKRNQTQRDQQEDNIQVAADLVRIAEIRQEMDDLGGLDMYQKASTLGQSKQRGGDSSKWLIPILETCHPSMNKKTDPSLRLLDVGALSPHNYQRYASWIHTTPIDLNPQDPLITKMDFLEMPIPTTEDSLFDIVCLSLVVNFVGDPTQRGEILRRATRFLVPKTGLLYLVLPLPCIDNSRYMDHALLVEMMDYLGFSTLVKHHFAKKLAYYVFQLDSPLTSARSKSGANKPGSTRFPKKMRHDKPNRNK